jgi:hypothetical protein
MAGAPGVSLETDRMNNRRREIKSKFRCDADLRNRLRPRQNAGQEKLPNALSGFFRDER